MPRMLSLLAVTLLAGCGTTAEPEQVEPARAAEPQTAALRWRESYPSSGKRLRFAVDRLEVRRDGWSVDIAVTNSVGIPFELGRPLDAAFGLMLFETGDLGELTEAADAAGLPPLRQATSIVPAPPRILAPNATWRATLSAPGSLADGSWVRVSFGPLEAVGTPPAGMQSPVVWITDKAHRL
ncbi:MAG: hypothetical protein H0V68_03965 [Actinobacteria bacterium]|nr:hypothetical protein [Actinomycetota bacterium]